MGLRGRACDVRGLKAPSRLPAPDRRWRRLVPSSVDRAPNTSPLVRRRASRISARKESGTPWRAGADESASPTRCKGRQLVAAPEDSNRRGRGPPARVARRPLLRRDGCGCREALAGVGGSRSAVPSRSTGVRAAHGEPAVAEPPGESTARCPEARGSARATHGTERQARPPVGLHRGRRAEA